MVEEKDGTFVAEEETFAEVPFFGETVAGNEESGDCSCFSCDGNPGC